VLKPLVVVVVVCVGHTHETVEVVDVDVGTMRLGGGRVE
jgi:hypothetical protein